MMILIVTQTTFLLSEEALVLSGFIYLGGFAFIVFINLLVIGYLSVNLSIYKRKRGKELAVMRQEFLKAERIRI